MNKLAVVLLVVLATAANGQKLPFRDVGPSNTSGGVSTLDTLNVTNRICWDGAACTRYTLYNGGTGAVQTVANTSVFNVAPAFNRLDFNGVLELAVATAAAPAFTFTGDNNTGVYNAGADRVGVTTGGVRSIVFSATSGRIEGTSASSVLGLDDSTGACLSYTGSSFCAATNVITMSASGGMNITAGTPISIQFRPVFSGATPTISSGFGTTPSVTAGFLTAFRLNVGTGGTASSGVIATNINATNGWNCTCTDLTTNVGLCKQTASTVSTVTIGQFTPATGVALAWAASSIVAVSCVGF